DNMEKALAIFSRLRTRAAKGKVDTACDDKNIELTLGRHLQIMGGADNLDRALAIFTRLRTQAAKGLPNTPCDDKEIELALGRLLQIMGGTANLERALTIFTRLRTRAAKGRENSPCDDMEIELAFGHHLQIMGGKDRLKQALAIFTRLRSRAAKGQVDTPCDDKGIELSLGSCFLKMEMWQSFDELHFEKRLFQGFEPQLLLSLRSFNELLGVMTITPEHLTPEHLTPEHLTPEHLTLLGKALGHAALAAEASGGTNASCLSQLAHCFRLLSFWPIAILQALEIQPQEPEEFKTRAKSLFAKAYKIEPGRQLLHPNQPWRETERAFRARLVQ
ncbi:MAG: hypothetical protein OXC07_05365, partial [Kistimonas sp.]|nr:hypothetical protein [Kistimonas sp.]